MDIDPFAELAIESSSDKVNQPIFLTISQSNSSENETSIVEKDDITPTAPNLYSSLTLDDIVGESLSSSIQKKTKEPFKNKIENIIKRDEKEDRLTTLIKVSN